MDTLRSYGDRSCSAGDSGIENCSRTSAESLPNPSISDGHSEATVADVDLNEDIIEDTKDVDSKLENGQQNHVSSNLGSAFETSNNQSHDEDSVWDCDSGATCARPTSICNDKLTFDKYKLLGTDGRRESIGKLHEIDIAEERDSFSPVSTGYSSDQPIDEPGSSFGFIQDHDDSPTSNNTELDNNKVYNKRKNNNPTSTKEEKQRQNEEIVIMETSSISSETGSWESVFPHKMNPEIKDSCDIFLQNERQHCFRNVGDSTVSSTDNPNKISEQPMPSGSKGTACFIDASTLLDEPEIVFTTCHPEVSHTKTKDDSPEKTQNSDKVDWQKKLKLDQLESFHKSFEMCKTSKPIHRANDSSSSSSEESPQKVHSTNEESTNNLSDEEKLWKREISKKAPRIEVKDQYVNENLDTYQEILKKSLNSFEAGPPKDLYMAREKDEVIRTRMDNERKQGNLIFQNSIQQFSGHAIDPIIPFPENSFEDLSSQLPVSHVSSSNEGLATESNSLLAFSNADPDSDYSVSNRQDESNDSCFLPQTPHNSIVQIGNDSTRLTSINNVDDTTSESSFPIKIPKRSLKCDESAPILSGGVSVEDFTPKQCESPPVRRKTEACPIVSGGFSSLDYKNDEEESPKPKEKPRMSQSITSWVVDMSDCKNQRNSSTSSSSADNTSRSIEETSSCAKSVKNGTGFYVSLSDLETTNKPDKEERPTKTSHSLFDNIKKSTGFYVDLSESENSTTATPPPSIASVTSQSSSGDKRNIFSMFIDFGGKKSATKRELNLPSLHLASNQHSKKDQMTTNSPRTVPHSLNNSARKKLEYKIESDDESIERTRPGETHEKFGYIKNKDKFEQHEETTKKLPCNESAKIESPKEIPNLEKRVSVESNDNKVYSGEEEPLKPQPTDIIVSPMESEFSNYSVKSSSNASNSAQAIAEEDDGNPGKMRKHRCDVKINETFDKSSQDSLTDGIFSKDISPVSTATETLGEETFQHDNVDIICEVPYSNEKDKTPVMEVIDELTELTSPSRDSVVSSLRQRSRSSGNRSVTGQESSPTHTMETLHATIEKQKQLLETVSENAEINTNFVKLSDMDKPATKFELHSPDAIMSKSVGSHRNITRLFQENRARPHSWIMTRSTGNNLMNITSSVENLKSLTRLFPHLSKELSNSVPSNVSLDIASENSERNQSDMSGESSLTSSISRSAMDESSISSRQPRRLGEDLLKMFLQEIGTDVVVDVNGRRIKAHKCILRSRCQYFAAILAGGWVESAGNVISLSGYSYSAVHFALCHIYSGASHPPEGISLMELAALADLLGLEGLKEVTAHALKINYCHNFHRPCNGCIDGALQVLPVALNHALDDLYRKCLKWTCRHYMKVWPTRAFAHLPNDILARCRQQIVAHLSSESVLETILDCNQLIIQLEPCRWAGAIENIVRDILDAAHAYVSDHFATLIASDSFLSLGHDKSSYIPRLENLTLRVASTLSPDQACRSYQRVTRLNSVLAAKVIKVPGMSEHHSEYIDEDQEEEMDWDEEFIRFVSAILSAVEQCLTRQCARAMRASAWQRMDLELRKKIQKLACLTEPLDIRRNKVIAKQNPFNTNNRNHDLYQVKLAIRAHSKKVQSQDTDQTKTTAHTQTTHANNRNIQTIEKAVQANHETDDGNGKLGKKCSVTNGISKPGSNVTHSEQSKIKSNDTKVTSVNRRNQSQNSSFSRTTKPTATQLSTTTSSSKLTAVRSRYLEPKKVHAPVKSDSRSNISSLKNKQVSSTESSKTSSPVTGKTTNVSKPRQLNSKSMNVSADSLASPARNCGQLKNKVDMEISIDSLAESMQSNSTEKTVSQESLIRHSSNMRKEQLILTKNASMSHVPVNKDKLNGRLTTTTTTRVTRTKSLSCQTSGSTPSSVTNKSSRLSSTTSSVDSPRDKSRTSSVNSGGQCTGQQRASFLSARSREILARKAASLGNNQSSSVNGNKVNNIQKQDKPTLNTIVKSSSSSNIPKRRPLQPTTLHLRKTAKLIPNLAVTNTNNSNKTINNSSNILANVSKISPLIKKQVVKSDKTIEKVLDNNKLNEKAEVIIEKNVPELRIESKLERSSTFCKEVSDFPTTELKIIE